MVDMNPCMLAHPHSVARSSVCRSLFLSPPPLLVQTTNKSTEWKGGFPAACLGDGLSGRLASWRVGFQPFLCLSPKTRPVGFNPHAHSLQAPFLNGHQRVSYSLCHQQARTRIHLSSIPYHSCRRLPSRLATLHTCSLHRSKCNQVHLPSHSSQNAVPQVLAISSLCRHCAQHHNMIISHPMCAYFVRPTIFVLCLQPAGCKKVDVYLGKQRRAAKEMTASSRPPNSDDLAASLLPPAAPAIISPLPAPAHHTSITPKRLDPAIQRSTRLSNPTLAVSPPS